MRARVVLRLSGCPLLVPPCGWPNAWRGRGWCRIACHRSFTFYAFIALTLCVKHSNTCVTFVKFCELGYVAGDVAVWV